MTAEELARKAEEGKDVTMMDVQALSRDEYRKWIYRSVRINREKAIRALRKKLPDAVVLEPEEHAG